MSAEKFSVVSRLTKADRNSAVEYGARGFIDQGEDPQLKDPYNAAPNFDHELSWGHPREDKFERLIEINGFACSHGKVYPFCFDKADMTSDGERGLDLKATGWIVLRYYRIVGYKQNDDDDDPESKPKRKKVPPASIIHHDALNPHP